MASPIPAREDLDWGFFAWVGVGFAVATAIGFVVYSFLGTFVFAIFIYYSARPIHKRVEQRISQASVAAATSLFLLLLPLLLLVGFTLSIALQEITTLARQNQLNVIGLETRLFIYIQPYMNLMESPFQLFSSPEQLSTLQQLFSRIRPFLEPIVNVMLHGFIMLGVAFYLLRDDQHAGQWLTDHFEEDGSVSEFIDALDEDFHKIFFGNILNAVLTGLIGAVIFNGVNLVAPSGLALPYPTLLGFLCGAASLVPLVGMKLVYVPATIYLLGTTFASGNVDAVWFPTLFGVVAFVLVDVVPDLVLRPYVSGKDLHTGMVMFAYVLGPILFGWYGLFLGPMILVFVVQFNRIVLPKLLAQLNATSQPAASRPAPVVATDGDVEADGQPVPDSESGSETESDGAAGTVSIEEHTGDDANAGEGGQSR
jgi:predicted PurR-regulated permease PerM